MASVILAGTTSTTALNLTGDTSGELQLKTNNGSTTAMTLTTAGNVGIGTASPSYKLDVANTGSSGATIHVQGQGLAAAFDNAGGNVTEIDLWNNGVQKSAWYYDNSASLAYLYAVSGAGLAFSTNATERMRITSGGNVGIGNTIPNSFDGFANQLVVGSGSGAQGITIYSGTGGTGALSFADGTSGDASYRGYVYYNHNNDSMAFYTAGANQRMIIDSSGNVGIGTSSPSHNLTVTANGATSYIVSKAQASYAAYVTACANNGTVGTNSLDLIQDSDGTGYLYLRTDKPLIFGTNNTERMRITSDGSVSIGTSTGNPLSNGGTQKTLAVSGGSGYGSVSIVSTATADGSILGALNFGSTGASSTVTSAGINVYLEGSGATNASGNMRFFTRNGVNFDERGRFTSGGYFKASNDGTYVSTSAPYHELRNTASDWVLYARNTAASNPYCMRANYSGAAPNNTGNQFLYCDDTSSLRAEIRSNGGLANYSANNSNLSDRREKTNFAPAKNYLDIICSIPVQTFNYIDQNLEEDDGLTLGVVAQDVQKVAPELVTESNWGTKEEPKMRLSIYQTDLQYALMKCIQEQQAMIEELKQEVAKLKGV